MAQRAPLPPPRPLDVSWLLSRFPGRVASTWSIVLAENLFLASLPLFIGRAIDALLAGESGALLEISVVMGALLAIAVGRRIHDTRAYGTMRVWFGVELAHRTAHRPVSTRNARLDMGREMVDFLEEHVPELLTAVVQIVVSISILWHFDGRLGVAGACAVAGLGVAYGAFHRRFYRLNGALNAQRERQVSVLEARRRESIVAHLRRLRRDEIRISDAEALLYGVIFAAMFAFLLTNLWLAATIASVTAGMIFAILSYSWELVESSVRLPVVLQQWTRLTEIRARINEGPDARTRAPIGAGR